MNKSPDIFEMPQLAEPNEELKRQDTVKRENVTTFTETFSE